MDKSVQNLLIKLEQLENRIEYIEKMLSISSPIDRELLKRSCEILLKRVLADTTTLQQELGISKNRSIKIFQQLDELGIVKTTEKNSDPFHPARVGKISKYKIKQYLENNS